MNEATKFTQNGGISVITLNRPGALNALSMEMITEVLAHLVSAADDETVRAVVITGEGKAFCAGGDLKLASTTPGGVSAAFDKLAPLFHETILKIRHIPKPVIAALNGATAGGGLSLALACDFRVMARSAILLQAYTSNGLCVNGGGTFTLPRLVGLARALEICSFDEPIPADKALEWGLITRVADDGNLMEETMAMARTLSRRSVHSFGWTKRLLIDSFETCLDTQLEREAEAITECANHPDGIEGVRAFLEKRPPDYIR